MISIRFSLGLSLIAFAASCAPTATNTEEPNDLVVNPATVTMTATDTTRTTGVSLVCGCPFPLPKANITEGGDVAQFDYSLEKPDQNLSVHTVKIVGIPNLGTAGQTYNYFVAFSHLEQASGRMFRDTVRATMTL